MHQFFVTLPRQEDLLVCSGNQKNKYKWAKQLLKEVNTENKIGPTD